MLLERKHLIIGAALLAVAAIGVGVYFAIPRGCDPVNLEEELYELNDERKDELAEVFEGAVGVCFPDIDVDIGERQSGKWCRNIGKGKSIGMLGGFVPGCEEYYESDEIGEICREVVLLDSRIEQLEADIQICKAANAD